MINDEEDDDRDTEPVMIDIKVEEDEMDGEPNERPFNLCYASYCLFVITFISISGKWTMSAMS